jgi:hypothetical protein
VPPTPSSKIISIDKKHGRRGLPTMGPVGKPDRFRGPWRSTRRVQRIPSSARPTSSQVEFRRATSGYRLDWSIQTISLPISIRRYGRLRRKAPFHRRPSCYLQNASCSRQRQPLRPQRVRGPSSPTRRLCVSALAPCCRIQPTLSRRTRPSSIISPSNSVSNTRWCQRRTGLAWRWLSGRAGLMWPGWALGVTSSQTTAPTARRSRPLNTKRGQPIRELLSESQA